MTFDTTPVLLRVAGLPARTMEPLASTACQRQIESLLQLENDLATVRSELVECMYRMIHGAPNELRRFLLAVKRDCYNRRSLGKWKSSPLWPNLHIANPQLFDLLSELEERIAAWRNRFKDVYQSERERERASLLDLLHNREFRRGLALAAPVLVGSLDRLRKPSSYGRRERGMDQSLLRYVSRTAFKLSPFSTFTRVCFGLLDAAMEPGLLRLDGQPWRQRTLVRLKRHIVSRYHTLLSHHPVYRAGLPIAVNDTVEPVKPQRFRFVRAGRWVLDPDGRKLKVYQESLVQLGLTGALIERVCAVLSEGHSSYGDLIANLAKFFDISQVEALKTVDKLIDQGFLELLPPWQSLELDSDQVFLDYLRSLPEDELLRDFRQIFENLLAVKHAFGTTEAPEERVAEVDAGIDEGFRLLGERLFSHEITQTLVSSRNLNEDVFLRSASGGEELARIPMESAERAVTSARPLLRFAFFFSQRHDVLHTLKAFSQERWPGRNEVGVLELFEAVQPLWLEFRKFIRSSYEAAGVPTWNPLGLASIAQLQELRNRLWQEATRCFHLEGDEFVISEGELDELMNAVPGCYAPLVGACLFIQPADDHGDLWVANRILEGTGRYGSRYSVVMSAKLRRRYSERVRRSSTLDLFEGQGELLDMLSARDNHLNVHAAQTPRVLEMLGEVSGLEDERRLRINDLRVRLDGPGPLPFLVDNLGRRVLPTHLGAVSLRLMPGMMRFLAQFGPGEFGYPIPPLPARQEGDLRIQRRVKIGNVIMRRKRWIMPSAPLRALLADASDVQAYERIQRWRLDRGLPDHIFLSEKLPVQFFGQDVYKPQYLNFTSPLFVSIFVSILKAGGDRVILEEMLPTPDLYPMDNEGERWAVELQLDSLLLNGRPGGTGAAKGGGRGPVQGSVCGRRGLGARSGGCSVASTSVGSQHP